MVTKKLREKGVNGESVRVVLAGDEVEYVSFSFSLILQDFPQFLVISSSELNFESEIKNQKFNPKQA